MKPMQVNGVSPSALRVPSDRGKEQHVHRRRHKAELSVAFEQHKQRSLPLVTVHTFGRFAEQLDSWHPPFALSVCVPVCSRKVESQE